MFDLKGKIALVTGGASGIGLCYIKELLRGGVQGVTLVDVNPETAQSALVELENEFGPDKVQFVRTDVSDIHQFEDAFKRTVETFGHIDILINNAGMFNDNNWKNEIATNFNGVVHGIVLGLENYLPKYTQEPEAVIVNTSSVGAFTAAPGCPIYCGTKAAVVAMTRCWGDPYHYERTKVRLFAVCPGGPTTPMLDSFEGKFLGTVYDDWVINAFKKVPSQRPDYVAQEVKKLIESCSNGSIWVITGNQPATQYIVPERQAV